MVLPFYPWHLGMMNLPPEKAREVARCIEGFKRLGAAGWVRTIVADRPGKPVEVLGVAGVSPCGGGQGEVFVVSAEKPQVREFVMGVRQLLEQARGHFATIQALGDEGDPRIERWLSWLGFKKVGQRAEAGKMMAVWRLA